MTNTVKLFSFVFSINGSMYGGQIPATSWDAAQEMVKDFAIIDGTILEEHPVGAVCSICAGDVVKDLSRPQPVGNEWPEEIE